MSEQNAPDDQDDALTADEAWPRIHKSLGDIYLTELYWLGRQITEACEHVFVAAPEPPKPADSYLKVDHALLGVIIGALSNAARLNWLITDRQRRKGRDGQSAFDYEIQLRRTAWLRGLLAGLELDAICDPKVRHSLEHFDEYVDATGIAGVRGEIATPTYLPVDFVIGRDGTLERIRAGTKTPTVYALRVYLAAERIFVNAGRRISLDALHREAMSIVDRVAPLLPEMGRGDERGSGMQVLVDW